MCTSMSCREDYQRQYGRDLLTDIRLRGLKGGLEPHVQKWQDQAVEDIVREVSQQSKALKPDLIISVDGNPIPSFLIQNPQGRQEVKWANAGLIDIIFNMDYSSKPDFDKFEIIRQELNNPDKLLFLLGNYYKKNKKIYSRNPEKLINLIDSVQDRWHNGIGIYIYSMLDEKQVESLASKAFKIDALPHWHR